MPRRKFKNLNRKRSIFKASFLKVQKSGVEILGEKSITVEKSELYPSFKKMFNDNELIQNPNIVKIGKFRDLKNKKSDLQHKFDNENDPIYDLDEDISKVDKTLPEIDPVIEYYSNYIDAEIKTKTTNSNVRGAKMESPNAYWGNA